MKIMRRKKGFTIIEMLISSIILALVCVGVGALISHAARGWSSGTSSDYATTSATLALQKLCYEIRDARSATVSSGTLTVTFPNKLVDTGTGEVIYDSSSSSATTRSYYLSNGKLMRQVGGVASVFADCISSVTFGASGGSVNVTLTADEQVGMSTSEKQVTGKISLRNFRS
ncbi:MAG: prepilin-type N-terminal cleavage/methylation domain-containing protein [Armatimonadetes bacterium]|nr:prepilin-type N-terminal cleavage/methylation domain-containing protein [Armatimonadota bacterium]